LVDVPPRVDVAALVLLVEHGTPVALAAAFVACAQVPWCASRMKQVHRIS